MAVFLRLDLEKSKVKFCYFSLPRARVKLNGFYAKIPPVMKKAFFFFPLALLPLCACGPIDEFNKVDLAYGTLIGMSEEIKGTSHMKQIDYPTLRSMVLEKQSFLLMVHNDGGIGCSCYADWHDDVLVPYLKEHNLLLYWIDYNDIVEEEDYGLELVSNHETLAIFDDGELAYQHDNVDQESDWVTSRAVFSEWMDARINYPKMIYIDKAILDEELSSNMEFTLLFTQSGCPDCGYLESHFLKQYFIDNRDTDYLYVLDTVQEGVRLLNGVAGSDEDDASEEEKAAYAQWVEFKKDYHLSAESIEQPGYKEGFVPTIFHYDVQGEVDGAGVFYNDTIDEATWKLTDTYWTSDKLDQPYFTYINDAKIDTLMDNVTFKAPETPISGAANIREYKHELLATYHEKYAKALLDWSIGNQKEQ